MPNTDLSERTQNNAELLAEALSLLLNKTSVEDSIPVNENQRRKAAYALNLCTVSVSQIIDYNDVNFMEREYEAILNNLNLEEMPKDEALLHILKQLLDVVSFFRIQEGEKKLLEKEYQQKMKNAIWNAVPNIGLIPVGGNPVTTVISLASQVGIGYMNYRKEKAKIGLEQERKEWELQRSAMEQFHGLRRELFDTAWRLAEKYHFQDSYRLTERQITQYNRILMDSDDLRRYERLSYIQGNFDAYPPFWYYLGSAANSVYQNSEMNDESLREEYKALAKKAFKKFLDIKEKDLLREDQLKASCALEYVDLIDDLDEKRSYLKIAKKASGNAYDVLELCAMSYLKIGDYQTAAELFRVLVNEDYNTKVNAQLLSRLYASMALSEGTNRREIEKKYHTLQSRVEDENLFPLPPDNSESGNIDGQFLATQKKHLKRKYVLALSAFVSKYAEAYEKVCQMDGNILNAMRELLDDMCKDLQLIVSDDGCFIIPMQTELSKIISDFKKMLIYDGMGSERPITVEFATFTKEAFEKLASEIKIRVNNMDSMYLISEAETALDQFCSDNDLQPQIYQDSKQGDNTRGRLIADTLFGGEIVELQRKLEKSEKCLKSVKTVVDSGSLWKGNREKANVHLYCRGDNYFDLYLKKNTKELQQLYFNWRILSFLNCKQEKHYSQSDIIAVLNDRSMRDRDLILSTEAVTLFEKKKYKGTLLYSEACKKQKNGGIAFENGVFKNDGVDIDALCNLFNQLAAIQEEYKPNEKDDKVRTIISTIRTTIQTNSFYDEARKTEGKVSCNAEIITVLEVEKELHYFYDEITVLAYATLRPLRVGGICQLRKSGILEDPKYVVKKIETGVKEIAEIECRKSAIFKLVRCTEMYAHQLGH